MLVKLKDNSVSQYPYTREMLQADWPNVSFPLNLEEVDLSEFGAAYVDPTTPPSTSNTQMVIEVEPSLSYDRWIQSWDIVDAPPELVAEWTEAAWLRLRNERNRLLAECDWTMLSDSPVAREPWAEYRQALRDLPSNTSDPFNPVWPVPPT